MNAANAPLTNAAPVPQAWTDQFWTSRDGLKLHFRDYAGPADKPPLLCMAGLTRNARDFAALAERLAGTWRVICPDLRGRGDSDYAKDSATYNPLQYAEDIELLLEQEQIERFVPFGTSLGGLITMLLAANRPERIAGVLLNDVGPELDPAGLARIREYVGQGRSFPTWMHAARGIEESQSKAYPRYSTADWLGMAKRVMVLGAGGRIVFDYDMKIADALVPPAAAEPAPQFDMWPLFLALGDRPATLLRGALSDVLSADAHARMAQRLAGADAVTVAAVGHAPMLDEPEAAAAVDRLLARIA
jgi:pimeloyl-ACP methyl ester carboxylesterase